MRISDWSSDVCSSDLHGLEVALAPVERVEDVVHLLDRLRPDHGAVVGPRRPEPGPRPALPAHVPPQRLAERCDGAPEERLAAALRAVETEATVVVSAVLGAVPGQPGARIAPLSPVVRGTASCL